MRRNKTAVFLLMLAAACAPKPSRTFAVGVQVPAAARDRRAVRFLGLPMVERVPEEAASALAIEGETMAGWSRLRYLGARAAAEGKAGVFFILPVPPEGRALVDYPEEWQALARAANELNAIRPIVEAGVEEGPPMTLPPGIEGRGWRYQGRDYAVLVNVSDVPVHLEEEGLARFRALFEVRADPRELLSDCPAGRCLAPERVLWLEGRYR